MLFMLGRLDGKLDGICTQLASITSRADGHETRIRDLEAASADRKGYVPRFVEVEGKVENHETRLTTIETTARTVWSGVGVLWAVFGAGIMAAGFVLLRFVFHAL